MFPFRKKKKTNVSTQPLVPESPFTRASVNVESGDVGTSRGHAITLPPSRRDYRDLPPQWHERRCTMVIWTYLSMVMTTFCLCCAVGAILGVVGGSCYICRCCKPSRNEKGMRSACLIHYIAFAALIIDIITAVVFIGIGTFYIVADCPFVESLCDVRAVMGLAVYVCAIFMIVHFILSLEVFLSMRDYRREMQREEMLQMRFQAEMDERFREYQRRQAAKNRPKKTRHRDLAAP